jgi:hypothetical protein
MSYHDFEIAHGRVFMVTYRPLGYRTGRPTSETCIFSDAQTAYDYVDEIAGKSMFPHVERIDYIGFKHRDGHCVLPNEYEMVGLVRFGEPYGSGWDDHHIAFYPGLRQCALAAMERMPAELSVVGLDMVQANCWLRDEPADGEVVR